MAEILLEGRDCETCGTEVRKGALFCYHCGSSVAPDVAVTTDLDEKVGDAWFREDVTESVSTDETETIEESGEDETVEEAEESSDKTEIADDEPEIAEDQSVTEKNETEIADAETAIEKEAGEKPKLKTAAAMRRKPKRIQKKRVEIVWEEPASPPNVWFLIATVFLAAVAIGLWFLAKYLG